MPTINAEMLLTGYAQGIFPMAESREATELLWFEPQLRGIIPLDGFHISRSLARVIRHETFEVKIDSAFDAVVMGCADRPETWINPDLFTLYQRLFQMGFAHSVEVWADGQLAGGTFGIVLGGAFFGESMFSRHKNASKVALAYAVDHLRQAGFALFDTQYLTPHLASLGGIEISRNAYRTRLKQALNQPADFSRPTIPAPQELLQRMTQTS